MTDKVDAILADYAKIVSPSLGIDEAIVENTLKNRKDAIVDFLDFYSYPDDSSDEHKDLKDIYKKYQTQVSDLLAQLEVNIHDLDGTVLGVITDLHRANVLLRRPEANDNHVKSANNIMYVLIHILQIKLIESYLDKIKYYRKFLRSFNQKGVKVPIEDSKEESFYEYAQNKYKALNSIYTKWRRAHKNYYRVGNNLKEYFDTQEEVGLTSILEEAQALNNLYEEYYAQIINNGYGSSILTKVFNAFLIIIPASLIIVSMCLTFRG